MITQPTLEQQIRERREEEQKLSQQHQQNNRKSSLTGEKANFAGEMNYKDQHFMDSYICLDSPWSESQ